MSTFSIAAAQSSSIKGDVEANVQAHSQFVKAAVEKNIDIIVFPELSLTGYEPTIAREVIIATDDKRLYLLKEQALQYGITIVVGAPIECTGGKPYIGSLIFSPKETIVYIKNYLHPGEEKFFSPGIRKCCVLNIKEQKVGIAICADVDHEPHAKDVAINGATIYASSVLMMGGYELSAQRLRTYAKDYKMIVLMANYGSSTSGHLPAGKSAIWDTNGRLLASANETGNALVIATKDQNKWVGTLVKLDVVPKLVALH